MGAADGDVIVAKETRRIWLRSRRSYAFEFAVSAKEVAVVLILGFSVFYFW